MYTIVRKIHLYSGLSLLLFVLLYFVSGLVMTHETLFPRQQPSSTVVEYPLEYQGTWTAQELGAFLATRFDLHGRMQDARELKDGGWSFVYASAGQENKLRISPGHDKVTITHTPQNTVGVLHRLHRLHRYGGPWFYSLWAFVYDLTSLSMILFAVTGIYLWYKLTARRLLGWILLSTSFGYALTTVLYLLYAP